MTASKVLPLRRLADTSSAYGDEYDVPPGRYTACVESAQTAILFGGRAQKVILTYRILDYGPCFEKRVRGYYAVRHIVGKPRRNGRYSIGPRSRLIRDTAHMIDGRPPTDHFPIEKASKTIVEIELRIVTTADGKDLASSMQYVVVDHVVKRLVI